MVAHEFRNPLAVISSALENLQLKSISDVQRRRRYRNMRLATNRLVQLTDNCLADSRLSSDGLVLERERLNVLEVVSSAAEVVDRSEHHRWQLLVNGEVGDVSQQVNIPVMGDHAMLRIAFSNLLDNAVKYSKQGPVEIDVTTRKNGVVCIAICDRGKGIAPADAQVIFERYRRHAAPAAQAQGHDPGGTGLGLYVARQIARAHGGDVVLAYSTNQGSCFEMSLPAAR
jgi:signal transduction histidine kinase